jgi:branched-chain amino acid transport system substrate-binding protein
MKKTKMLVALIFALLVVLTSVPSFAQPVLKLGSFNPRTGPGASWGLNTDKFVDLCVEQWNKKGGVTVQGQKYKIEMIHEDDKYRGEEAVKAVNKLIFTDKVKFIVGPLGSSSVMAVQPITEANKVIILCGSYGPIELLKGKNYTFRTVGVPTHSSPAFFKFLSKRYPELKTSVHLAPKDASGWGATQGDNDSCDAVGIKVLASEFFEIGSQDFTSVLARIIPLKPDFISLNGSAGGYCALIIKQARELGFKGRFIHAGIFVYDEVGPIAGWENIEGLLTSSISPEGPLCPQGIKDVYALWMEKYKSDVGFSMAFLYNHANILLWGIEKANSLDSEKVKEGIENLGEFNVIQGKAHWGGKEVYGINHQIFHPHMISEVKDRKLVAVGMEMPWEIPPPQKKWW